MTNSDEAGDGSATQTSAVGHNMTDATRIFAAVHHGVTRWTTYHGIRREDFPSVGLPHSLRAMVFTPHVAQAHSPFRAYARHSTLIASEPRPLTTPRVTSLFTTPKSTSSSQRPWRFTLAWLVSCHFARLKESKIAITRRPPTSAFGIQPNTPTAASQPPYHRATPLSDSVHFTCII